MSGITNRIRSIATTTAMPHAQRHRVYDHMIGHCGDLRRQNLQIRLGNRDQKADEKAYDHHHQQFAGFCNIRAYRLTNRLHCLLRAQRKKAHPHNCHHCACQKRGQGRKINRHNGKTEHKHNTGDREYRGQSLFQFLNQSYFICNNWRFPLSKDYIYFIIILVNFLLK